MLLPKSLILMSSLIVLSACGGAGPVSVDVPKTSVPPTDNNLSTSEPPNETVNPNPLDDIGTVLPDGIDTSDPELLATLAAFTANETQLSAVALVTDAAGNRSTQIRNGLYTRTDGVLSLAGLAATVSNDVRGDYDHAASFYHDQNGTVGVVGLATPTTAMPTNGNARYEGGASGFVITGTNGVDLINGSSVVDVAFATGRVTVTLDDFEGVNQLSGNVVASPVSEMVLSNAMIAGGGFSGGTLALRNDSGAVDITGSDGTTVAQGQFFGVDGTAPDEVGGVIFSTGTSGKVYGTFIAD
ncbi:hypothetical protein FHS72_000997 [Loktanella ponticola]|uniref:Transferrin-binding protein B C-lobe/N-lobe beta barrel domain-containing protein n=1 Tax=Yoonia ponticola TaxID=1524255 RepID=A0A7W9EYQ5_9RHOB|nr:transferrin-binding protein-like solute binding protein [Yoonia ponticola]MBB5721390.1 hypothetical protein [Yoonia ponticola]